MHIALIDGRVRQRLPGHWNQLSNLRTSRGTGKRQPRPYRGNAHPFEEVELVLMSVAIIGWTTCQKCAGQVVRDEVDRRRHSGMELDVSDM